MGIDIIACDDKLFRIDTDSGRTWILNDDDPPLWVEILEAPASEEKS